MPRIRTVKPEFWGHPVMGRLDDAAKCVALALLNYADDEGYFLADPAAVRSFARPFDEDSTIARRSLDTLSRAGWIEVREHPTHGAIGRVVNFADHQKVDRPKESKLSGYFHQHDSSNDRRAIDERSSLEQGTGNREGREDAPAPAPRFQLDRPAEFEQLVKRAEVIWSGDPGSFPAILRGARHSGPFLAAWNDPPLGDGIPLRAWLDAMPAYRQKRSTWTLAGLITFAKHQRANPDVSSGRAASGKPDPLASKQPVYAPRESA